MKRFFLYLILIIVTAVITFLVSWYAFLDYSRIDSAVYYNQDIEADRQIINVIQNANKFVYFAIYTFTLPEIKDALLGAKHRGLKVSGIVDKNQLKALPNQGKIVDELRQAGIPVAVQSHSAIMHIKAVVTDNGYASGSYNWTAAATNDNDEVLEVGHSEVVRLQYQSILEKVLHKYAP